MRRIHSGRAGITLIEVLIAVSLLSLLSVGMLVAMRIGINTMEKTDAHLVKNRRVANARKIIENEISGFMPTMALWRPRPDAPPTFGTFMEWTENSMRFVTAYSLEEGWRGRPQLSVLQVIPGERGQGVRLIVNELPFTGPDQVGLQVVGSDERGLLRFSQSPSGPSSFVLADRLAYCRFSFQERIFEPPFRIWLPVWRMPTMPPLGVRIDMAPLDVSPSELRVTSVTVAMPVNREGGSAYRDDN